MYAHPNFFFIRRSWPLNTRIARQAYHVGGSPSLTQGLFHAEFICACLSLIQRVGDINVVMHTLAVLADFLRQSEVGAQRSLALLERDATGQTEIPTEAELMRKATEWV